MRFQRPSLLEVFRRLSESSLAICLGYTTVSEIEVRDMGPWKGQGGGAHRSRAHSHSGLAQAQISQAQQDGVMSLPVGFEVQCAGEILFGSGVILHLDRGPAAPNME